MSEAPDLIYVHPKLKSWSSKSCFPDDIPYQRVKKKAMPETAPYSEDTTSKKAAKAIKNLSGKRLSVFEFIKRQGGATSTEIEKGLGFLRSTVSGRCWELHNAGYIVADGERKNPRGLDEIVWKAVANGQV